MINFWYSHNLIAYALAPFSYLFRGIVYLRRLLYRLGIKKTTTFSVPIIVIGNITVGGTGKTPLVIWLAAFLKQQGFTPGIVTRGYGGKKRAAARVVLAQSDPGEVGDEAVLLARRTACPVVVAPSRVRAVKYLLDHHACDVVLSDDGLQHYALARDIEIAVIDGERRLGNSLCLPAGPLREPPSRLKQVDFVVVNGMPLEDEYVMQLKGTQFYKLSDPSVNQASTAFSSQPIHAVAAIGNPERFFNALRRLNLQILTHPFPDHYLFKVEDFAFGDDAPIIMTEKDAVKCQHFADKRFWYLPVTAELSGDFIEALKRRLG